MRRPADIPGIDPELLRRYPADTLRALGQRLGLEDARAGSRASTKYIDLVLDRLTFYVPGWSRGVTLSADEMHEFVVGLITGLDECLRVLKKL